ncbi:hypothetical protein HDU97_002372 [Phlyctochytrium planicorne]|nr:hypothetical protein HDU97_002372 [Phlyctochytrium planicorne]
MATPGGSTDATASVATASTEAVQSGIRGSSVIGPSSSSSSTSSFSPALTTLRSFAYLAAGVACGLLIIRLWRYPSGPLFPSSFAELKRDILGHPEKPRKVKGARRRAGRRHQDEDERRERRRRRRAGFVVDGEEGSRSRRRRHRRQRSISTDPDVPAGLRRRSRQRSLSPDTTSPISPSSTGNDGTRRTGASSGRLLAPPASATSPLPPGHPDPIPVEVEDSTTLPSPALDVISPQDSNAESPAQVTPSSPQMAQDVISPATVTGEVQSPANEEEGIWGEAVVGDWPPGDPAVIVQDEVGDVNAAAETSAGRNQDAGAEEYDDEDEDEVEDDENDDERDDSDEDYSTSDEEDYDEDEDAETAGYNEESRNLLDLLYSIAEDQARKDGYVHRSITCNHCGTAPVRGFRFKCAHCVDYDLCETCEAADVHPRTHIFLKIRIPFPPHANPRSSQLPIFYPGKAIADIEFDRVEFRELASKTHFDVIELQAFYEQFRSLATAEETATTPAGITREIFEQCLGPLGLEKNLITERIFAFFDQDKDKLISFPELAFGLSILCKGSLDERIKYAFQGYDIDGDGVISRNELHRMFKAYFYLSMELVRDFVKLMEEGMMETFDDEASKPVSASFTAPIEGSGLPNDDDDYVKEDPGASSRDAQGTVTSRKGKRPVSMHESDYSGSILLGSSYAPAPSASSPGILSRGTRALQEHQLRRRSNQSMSTAYRNGSISISTTNTNPPSAHPNRNGSYDLPPSPVMATSPGFEDFQSTYNGDRSVVATPAIEGFEEQQWPVVEAMSQDAIEEMVEKTFVAAGAANNDFITLEEFKRAVDSDNSYLQWFEALGSVF